MASAGEGEALDCVEVVEEASPLEGEIWRRKVSEVCEMPEWECSDILKGTFCSGLESLRFFVEDVVYVSCLREAALALLEENYGVSKEPAADSSNSRTL